MSLTLLEEMELFQDCIASLSVLGGHVDAAYPLCPVLLEDSTSLPDSNMSLSAKLGSNYGVISRLLNNDMVEVIVSPQGTDNTGVLLIPWDKIRALSRCPLEGLEISSNLLESLLVLTHLVVLGPPFMCYFEGREDALSTHSTPLLPLSFPHLFPPSSSLLSGPSGVEDIVPVPVPAITVAPKNDIEWQLNQLSSGYDGNESIGSGSEGDEYEKYDLDAALAVAAYSGFGDQSTDDIPRKSDSVSVNDSERAHSNEEGVKSKDEGVEDNKDDNKIKRTGNRTQTKTQTQVDNSDKKDKNLCPKPSDIKSLSDRSDTKSNKGGNTDLKEDINIEKKDEEEKTKVEETKGVEIEAEKEEKEEKKEDNMKLLAHFLSLTASKAMATLTSVLPVADKISFMLSSNDTAGKKCIHEFIYSVRQT